MTTATATTAKRTSSRTSNSRETRNGQIKAIRRETWERERRKPIACHLRVRAQNKYEEYMKMGAQRPFYALRVIEFNGPAQNPMSNVKSYAAETLEFAKRLANTHYMLNKGTTQYIIVEIGAGPNPSIKCVANKTTTRN